MASKAITFGGTYCPPPPVSQVFLHKGSYGTHVYIGQRFEPDPMNRLFPQKISGPTIKSGMEGPLN